MILKEVSTSRPERQFRMVGAPGWYDLAFVIPGHVFAPGNKKSEIYIDPKSDAHLGAFALGGGSLKDWQELVAKPSRQSSCLRLSIAAALGAAFLRPLGLDSFGINWFSNTSDGKTLCLIVAASVAGLVGAEGLPGWADSQAAIEDLARGHRDCVMALDESGDGEHQRPRSGREQRLIVRMCVSWSSPLFPFFAGP
jgi:putative DNA primase/helicase